MFRKFITAGMSLALSLVLLLAPLGAVKAEAVTTTRVTGTVASGTTDATLYLKLNDGTGTMQIRLDSNTDTSECRIMVVGTTLTADVYRGSDAVMHASKVSSKSAATVDSSNQTTVSGTVASGTTEDLLLLSTDQGTMKIKIDSTTDLKNAGILYIGKPLSVVVARGSDAYMHAISVSFQTKTSHPGSVTVTGTVSSGTSESFLYLKTSDGIMQIKIDSDTDTEAGRVLVTGNTLTVEVYRGNDAYMHAAKIVGRSAEVSTDSTQTVRGAVSYGTTSSVLHLLTESGVMYIKVDSSTDMSGCGLLLEGQYLYVDVARGSDAYMHAIRIVNPNYTAAASKSGSSSGASGSVSHTNTREITGTPLAKSDDDTLYLDTNEGTYTIKLDDGTTMASKAFMVGHTTKVIIYPGGDGYYHADKITDDQYSGNQANVSSSTRQVTGTVGDKTSLNQLNLDTSDGTYKLRIDKSTEFDGIRFLKEGRKLTVTIANANDGYWHAVKISKASSN